MRSWILQTKNYLFALTGTFMNERKQKRGEKLGFKFFQIRTNFF